MNRNELPLIKSFELDYWSEPDENHHVKHIGMKKSMETFEMLKKHLEEKGLLPDEYFLCNFDDREHSDMELPDFEQAFCHTNYGGSEGIYIDILLQCDDERTNKSGFVRFATGKTLGETADDFLRMSRIAAECSLMLNGRGHSYVQETTNELMLNERESHMLRLSLMAMKAELDIGNAPTNIIDSILNRIKIAPIHQNSLENVSNDDEDEIEL